MAKGKKKGGGKATTGVEAAVSSLSIDDSGPSTSQAPVEEEEEDGGLTGGSRKKKPQKTKKFEPAEEKKDDKPLETAVAAEQAPPAKPDPPKETPEEEDCGGLGLTGGGKKRNRKKKTAPAAQQAQPAEQGAQPAAQPAVQPVGLPVGQPPQGISAGVPPGFPGVAGPSPGFPGVVGPSPGFPGAAGPARMVSPGPGQGPGWGAPQPATSWQKPAATPQQGAPPRMVGVIPQKGQASQYPGQSSAPTQATTPSQGPSGDKVVSYEPIPKSRQEQKCHYIIPAKILGKSVPCKMTKVITNYLPMTIKAIKVHRYDVTFKPDKPKKLIPTIYKIFKDKVFPNETIGFDMFKNAYSLNPLKKNLIEDANSREDDGRKVHEVEHLDQNGRVMHFKITLKYTGMVDFAKVLRHMENMGSSLAVPMEEVQCIDVILRQGTLESYVKAGRNFFKRPDRPIDLSGGMEIWTGLFQSAIFTSRPFINVDVAHKGFPKEQSMIDAWKAIGLDLNRGLEQQPGRSAESFKDFVKGLRVVCTMVGGATNGHTRDFIVNSVKERPSQLSFTKDNEPRPTTVSDYFLREKKYKIQFPHLPCLWVGPRDKNIFYPLELCRVAYGQALRRQLNEFQLATMVREAATPPDERKRKIEEVARSMNYSQNVFFKKFGLEISNQFLEVEAKVLQAPVLNCGEGKPTYPARGAWNSPKLVQPEALASWGFIGIELQPHQCNFDDICSLLLQTGTQMGMQVAKPKLTQFGVRITELRALLFRALEMEVRFLFVIVPFRGKDYYHKVKQFAECDVGILTQCIKEQTATRRMNFQTVKNILLKVNSKLMGINQVLANASTPRCIREGNAMIVGADVTHPSPDQQNIPSIAAVTASIDPKCFIYNIELSIQSPKEEVISQYEDMMYDHLKLYIERNGKPPKKIYVFRDGVSEGQFGQVMNKELTGLLNAYARFSKEKPEVLFLLVQKRHHTRLFGTDARTRKIINVEPGTVVDTHIVHPKELDFYLVSHAAIKGTARPTRYHSVCNDGAIPHDEVEQLTFYLCHLYSRCMRSVSYPTPTYYAHLACLRARSLTHGDTFSNKELEGKPKRLRVLDKILRSSRMFFV